MRQLTATQKTMLTAILKESNKRDQWGELNFKIRTVDDLEPRDWSELERINDTEILWSECDRFISDFNNNIIYG